MGSLGVGPPGGFPKFGSAHLQSETEHFLLKTTLQVSRLLVRQHANPQEFNLACNWSYPTHQADNVLQLPNTGTPSVPLLRASWSVLDGIWGILS